MKKFLLGILLFISFIGCYFNCFTICSDDSIKNDVTYSLANESNLDDIECI